MRRLVENQKLIIIICGLIISLSMMAYSLFANSSLPKAVTWVNDVETMIGRVVSAPTHTILDFGEAVNNLKATYTENQRLKSQISTLQALKAQNNLLRTENKELNGLLDLKPQLVGKTVISAKVITRSPDQWLDQLQLDVGSTNGIKKNMSVMTSGGLIGRVTEVNATSSTVRLYTSQDMSALKVSAGIQSNDSISYGVLKSYDAKKNELIFDQVPIDAKVAKGNLVVTSGLGGVSPEGLVIGEVKEVKVDNFGLSKLVRVKPGADFNDIRNVLVIMSTNEVQKSEAQPVTVTTETREVKP